MWDPQSLTFHFRIILSTYLKPYINAHLVCRGLDQRWASLTAHMWTTNLVRATCKVCLEVASESNADMPRRLSTREHLVFAHVRLAGFGIHYRQCTQLATDYHTHTRQWSQIFQCFPTSFPGTKKCFRVFQNSNNIFSRVFSMCSICTCNSSATRRAY